MRYCGSVFRCIGTSLVPVVATIAFSCDARGARAHSAEAAAAVSIPPDAHEVLAVMPNGTTLVLETARTEAERARGLMGRAEVPAGTGMIFFFPAPGLHSFWMLNCRVALDLVWLDASGTVVDVEAAAPACAAEPCPSYAPRAPASIVIEVAAHEAARLGLEQGVRVLLGPAPGRSSR